MVRKILPSRVEKRVMKIETGETPLSKFKQLFSDKELPYYGEIVDVVNHYPDKKSIILDFEDMNRYDTELADQLLDRPAEVIEQAEEAIKHMDLGLEDWQQMHVRFKNLPEESTVWVRDLRSEHIGKFIAIDTIIRTASEVRPQATEMTFECPECEEVITIAQDSIYMTGPTSCPNPTCNRRGTFNIKDKKLIDATSLKVQEPPDTIIGSEQPSLIRIELQDDLVSPKERKKILPGNRIRLTGILRDIQKRVNGPQGPGKSTQFDIFIEANHVETKDEIFEEIILTEEEEKEIKELAGKKETYADIIASIAPSIYGYEDIKEAIMLQLFAGRVKIQKDGTRIRGDIHIFLVGDPGTGKSQLLRYVSELAPKGRYVSGKGASAAGLTAAAIKDEMTGGWALEAGVLVLASGGVAAVDEFDKMNKDDVSAMHEALEQQTVSIAKAGMITRLNTKTAVLAAANPKFGRFDRYRNIYEQIDIGPAIMSRFDLKFPVQDESTKAKDEKLANHILKSYQDPDVIQPPIEKELLKKYVAYARRTCEPILSDEAADKLIEFYVEWRAKYSNPESGSVPLTARQLEAMVRLAEASAKIRLDDTVRIDDAERAVKLVESSLRQLGTNEAGEFDIDQLETGISSTQRSKIHTLLDILDKLETEKGDRILLEDVITAGKAKDMDETTIRDVIDKLKQKGDIYEPTSGYIKKA